MRRRPAIFAAASLAALGLIAGGCQIFAIAGVMADTFERSGSHRVYAEYTGLQGKTFAVVVSADRVILGNDQRVVTRVTNTVTNVLAGKAPELGAAGFVPGGRVLEFIYTNPAWTTWTYERLANEFTVDRLIMIDIYDYRLNEPGNAHLWDGQITARVGVVEADGGAPNEFSFVKDIRVKFPNKPGVTTSELSRSQVQTGLEQRFINRVTWLFFEHEEANLIDY